MEIWDAYDRDGKPTGEKLVRGAPILAGRYHLVCEVLVRHRDGSYLCMKRASTKEGYPGWLEATAGGSALAGEDKWTCVRRELREETGLDEQYFTEIGRFRNNNTIYSSFLCVVDCDKDTVRFQEGETEDYCWLPESAFMEFVNSGRMIPTQRQRLDPWLKQMGYVRRRIYLVRHGADDETVRGGWSDHPLTEAGKEQAEKLADTFKFPIERLYSSDLRRCMMTAQPLAEKLGLEIRLLPQFRETNNGELAGMKHTLACEKYPGLYWNTLGWEEQYPGGESPKEFYDRIAAAWAEFQAQDGDVMLVTHGGVINVILSLIHGLSYSNKKHRWKIRNTQIITLEFRNGKWEEADDQSRDLAHCPGAVRH